MDSICGLPAVQVCMHALKEQHMNDTGMILCGGVVVVAVAILITWRLFK